jgi:thymidylate kinase
MAHQVVPETALLSALKSLTAFAVLRNHDVLSHVATGGDIDLLVSDIREAKRQLVTELGAPEFVDQRSYVTGLFYDWGHVDLFPTLEWRGARYLDGSAVLQHRDWSPFGLPRPRRAHEALVSWFTSLLWGGFFKPRYRDMIVEAAQEDGEELARVLAAAVGRRWGRRLWLAAANGRPEESELWASQLRRAVMRRALARAPLQTIGGRLHFYLAEARLHLNPPIPWLTVLGPDGSGKSTLLAGLRDRWPRSLGSVHTHHLRPHRLSRNKASAGPVVDPHRLPPRGALTSVAALIFVMSDWWIGYWTRIVRERAKHGFVVFDRHLLDVLVDPLRYRYGGPSWVTRAACRLVPQPDVVVILDAPPVVVRARKQEVTPAESERQSLAYRRLATEVARAHLVDATVAPEEVLEAVTTIVRRHMRATARQAGGAGGAPDRRVGQSRVGVGGLRPGRPEAGDRRDGDDA